MTDDWLKQLEDEHGPWLIHREGPTSVRLFRDGFALQQISGSNAEWPLTSWMGPNSTTAQNLAGKYIVVKLQQAKAALDDARKEVEADIARFVQTGEEIENLPARRMKLRRLKIAFEEALADYRAVFVEPVERQRKRDEADRKRQLDEQSRRTAAVVPQLEALKEFETVDFPKPPLEGVGHVVL